MIPFRLATSLTRLYKLLSQQLVHQEKVKGLEAELAVLQQRVDGKDNNLAKCPAGYDENRE